MSLFYPDHWTYSLFAAAVLLLCGAAAEPATAQENAQNAVYPAERFESLEYRMIGPHRGGRVTAVAGTRDQPHTFYFGSTGGGVWKTTDAGESWANVSDGAFDVASVGAVRVAPSDPSTIYVGTGSACPRGNISVGRGVYKSVDGGDTWSFVGLPEAGQIGRILVHPEDKNVLYVAALGHIFGKNEERGVYKSTDGGDTWEKALYLSDSTGAVDLALNPENPEEVYAAMWRAERKPWAMTSGGGNDGLYKTTNGGEDWIRLEQGLPEKPLGRIGVTVSPANPDRMWALVEAEEGEGLYRSDDGGESFAPVNRDRKKLMARPWYYTHVFAHPTDENTVYVANEDFFVSHDGGDDFEVVDTPHGDNHDLWINPDDPDVMVEGNDGGANVTVNGGETWTTQRNQPTAEFYSVEVDNQFPYRVYAPQQDNSTISLPSVYTEGITPSQKWYAVGGCETGPISLDPDNPDVVYSGCYGGRVYRYDHETNQRRQIMDYPQLQLGQAERTLKYRFQWNAPIEVSRHDASTLYHASQYVHETTNEGQSWDVISPDLSRDLERFQGYAGGPITHDITGVEIFGSVFALQESPHDAEVLWAGTNDGRVHVRRGEDADWQDVTPPSLPDLTTINRIEPSPHREGAAYVAAYRYRYDDFAPYILYTDNYGEDWQRLTTGENGIPSDHPTRVVRADPEREGLLYAGTEFGLFVSFDNGTHWQPLQQNLPVSPVTDLKVHRNDLVVATQGRSLWILDDLEVLRQVDEQVAAADRHLYQPDDVRRLRTHGWSVEGPRWGENPPQGAVFHYYFEEAPEQEVQLTIRDEQGAVVRTYSSDEAQRAHDEEPPVPAEQGGNRFNWTLKYPGPDVVDDARPTEDDDIIWGNLDGPRAVPGTYEVELSVGDWSQTRTFEVEADPRVDVSREALQEQFDLHRDVADLLEQGHDALRRLRSVRNQLTQTADLRDETGTRDLDARADSIVHAITRIENALLETTPGDVAKLEPEWSSHLAWLVDYVASAPHRPNEQAYERYQDLQDEFEDRRETVEQVLDREVPAYNDAAVEADLPRVVVPTPSDGQ